MKELKSLIKEITFKEIFFLILILVLYFLPLLIFGIDLNFYNSLQKINVPPFIFSIAWTIIYLCLTFFIFWHYKLKNTPNKKTFWTYLLINYLIESSYLFVFFGLKNLFLSFAICLLTFITIILVALEAYTSKKQTVILLIPYILWSAFASVLAMLIYIWN